MNGTVTEPLDWSLRKRVLIISIAVVVQFLLINWFSARGPFQPRSADVRPAIQLVANNLSEWLSLTDPTLFSRAHPAGFSGPAWLTIPPHSYLPPEQGDVPLWLSPAAESLGATFREFVKNYTPDGTSLRSWRPPVVTAPTISSPLLVAPQSRLSLDGPLATRGLVTIPELPAWTNTDILAPSRVRVLVDAFGNPISAVLLNSSGLKAADQRAVEIAKGLSFGGDREALTQQPNDVDAGLATGWLIFSWRTLAPPADTGATNPR